MSAVVSFSPKWLETTYTKQPINTTIFENITLEVSNKELSPIFNKLDIKNIRLGLKHRSREVDEGKEKEEDKGKAEIREKRLMEYIQLDSKKYYFTNEDLKIFLDNPKFNIDYCNIYSPLFKNYGKPVKNINYLKNTIYTEFINKLEDYYLEINHQDQENYTPKTYNKIYNNNSDSESEDEWDIN
uniref:Uncharacterized protein n=1 Tax=viral metagenome TaxID=1070528 RepID=A0A6C0EJE8_9ZZZZ